MSPGAAGGAPRWPGLLAAGLVLLLCLGPLVPFLRAGGASWGGADWAALRFTLLQAALSALLATLLAVPVARALARRRFRGREALLALLGAPFILPTIVAVLGLLAIFGRQGVVNDGLAALGLPRVSIYGLGGVVGAHVVLNLPLALRLLLLAWGRVPAERFRLAATLGASVFVLIERPMLARALPGIVATIFALCLGSFAVALILGGGPRATTVELAIYQAARFEGDLGGAAGLALVQYALGAGAALLAALVGVGAAGAVRGRPVERWDAAGPGAVGADALAVGLAALVLLAPLGAAVLRGALALPDLPAEAGGAVLRSLAVALAATALCLVLAMALALRGGLLAEAAGGLPLAASSLVLGLGALSILGPRAGPWALPVAAGADALLALPFAVRALRPALAEVEARHGRLASALGLSGWARVRLLHLPLLRRPLGFAAGLAAAFSVGNLGAVALLAGEGQATLPLLMARLMGAYRMDAGAAVGLLTLGLALALFVAFDRWGRRGG